MNYQPIVGGFVYAYGTSEEGMVGEVKTDRAGVDWGAGVLNWYPLSAFVNRGLEGSHYLDVSRRIAT